MESVDKALNQTRRTVAMHAVLTERVGAEKSDVLWHKAEQELARLFAQYAAVPKAARRHTHGAILPAVAVYRVLQKELPEQAMAVMEEGVRRAASGMGQKLAGVTKPPIMRGVFLKIFAAGTKSMFGPAAGFQNVIYQADGRTFRMDITQCPYSRYCRELGCPELTHIFCDSDVYAYGGLTGIRFTRTQTIGSGGTKCDFLLKRE